MIGSQSLEFVIGYVFSYIEKKFLEEAVKKSESKVKGFVVVPKVWFGLNSSKLTSNNLPNEIQTILCTRLAAIIKGLTLQNWNINVSTYPDRQYICFEYELGKIPKPKKMTISEIQDILGYKIEIVE